MARSAEAWTVDMFWQGMGFLVSCAVLTCFTLGGIPYVIWGICTDTTAAQERGRLLRRPRYEARTGAPYMRAYVESEPEDEKNEN